jgi:membrane-associated phospholipid phosphatase
MKNNLKKIQTFNNTSNTSTNIVTNSKFFLHTLTPVLILMVTFIFLYLESNFDKKSYFDIQKDLFLNLNSFLNSYIPSILWANITYFGNTMVFLLLLSTNIIHKPKVWLSFFAAIPAAGIFSIVGKKLIAMPRPPSVLDNDTFVIIGDAITSNTSLPSGHSITVFAIIGVLVLLGKNKFLIFMLFLAAIAALSRVAVGAHWPIDLIIGGGLGYLSAVSGVFISQKYCKCSALRYNKKYLLIFIVIIWIFIYSLIAKISTYNLENLIVVISCLYGLIISFKLSHSLWKINKN